MGNKSQYDDAFRSHFLGPKQENQLQLNSSRTAHNHLKLGKEDYNSQTGQEKYLGHRRHHRKNKLSQSDQQFSQYNQQEQCSQKGSRSYSKQISLHVDSVSNKQQQNFTDSRRENLLFRNPKFTTLKTQCKVESFQTTMDDCCPQSINLHQLKLSNITPPNQQHISHTPLFTEYAISMKDMNVDPNHSALSKTSTGSNISERTVVSLKSVADLRETVRSQIAMTNMFDESFRVFGGKDKTTKEGTRSSSHKTEPKVSATVSQVLSPKLEPIVSQYPFSSEDKLSVNYSTRSQQDNDLCESVQMHSTGTAAYATTTCENSDTSGNFALSIDDLVNSKVINPMIRKLQRIYLNTLREEMSLMEDLENLPQMVSEVYRTTTATKKS